MKHVVNHDLGQDKAKQVAQAAFDSYKSRYAEYGPKANWVTDKRAEISFSVKGMTLGGTIDVTPSTIEMDLDVPFLLKPFKGKAMAVIEGEIRTWIGKAKAGEI
jgi:hypothetical protein